MFQQYWTKIAEDLNDNMSMVEREKPKHVPGEKIPTLAAVVAIAMEKGVERQHLKTSIRAYADRNSLFHSTTSEYMQKGKFSELAWVLHEDEQDLPLMVPHDRQNEAEADFALSN
ncbi:hypothetical protein MMC20_005596 [Loxospora ochrophaea]|nr:hypothetical protein [Loxospora ochrophaea]